jgi:hypothetical protein
MRPFREIIHQLTLNKDALVALGALAAVVSPFLVLAGIFASLRIAKKNLKGTLLTNQRRDWIDEVRNEVAAVLAALAPLRADSDGTRSINLMNKLELTRAKLTLLMDPKNTAQCELLYAVNCAIKNTLEAREAKAETPEVKEPYQLDPILSADIDRLIDTTQKVLAEAWEKARSLK